MIEHAVTHFLRQIQSLAFLLQHFHNPHALLVVPEPFRADPVQHRLAGMAEWCVAEIVSQGNGLCQILVQAKCPRYRPGDLRDLQRMGQPRPVVIAERREKHLRLMLEPAERLRVQDAVISSCGSSRSLPFDSLLSDAYGLRYAFSHASCFSLIFINTPANLKLQKRPWLTVKLSNGRFLPFFDVTLQSAAC